LFFIITLASVVVLLGIVLLRFLILLARFRRALAPRINRWIQDSVLQLQRRAYEAEGQGTWTRLDTDVPITTEKEKLTDLPAEPLPLRVQSGGFSPSWVNKDRDSHEKVSSSLVDASEQALVDSDVVADNTETVPQRVDIVDATNVEDSDLARATENSSTFINP
jgi:hypothetical protein